MKRRGEDNSPLRVQGFPQGKAEDASSVIATRDHEVIRQWAARHQAEPATGEATRSGPATVGVQDGGPGIRFNFPGIARFRPITWDEWFEHFSRHGLTFVYETELPDRAYALWNAGGRRHGHDKEDWLEAERQQAGSDPPAARYRFVVEH